MDGPFETTKVETSSSFYVEVEFYGEHHMGAETRLLIPSSRLEGVDRFRTTNGSVFYDVSRDRVYLRDACLILEVDPHTLQCRHLNRPPGWYFSEVSIEGDKVHFRLYDGKGGRKEKLSPYDELPWEEGLGAASEGRFPSGYP